MLIKQIECIWFRNDFLWNTTSTAFPRIVEAILFWKWKMWKFSYSFRFMAFFYFINWIVAAETIEGRKLFAEIQYIKICQKGFYLFYQMTYGGCGIYLWQTEYFAYLSIPVFPFSIILLWNLSGKDKRIICSTFFKAISLFCFDYFVWNSQFVF